MYFVKEPFDFDAEFDNTLLGDICPVWQRVRRPETLILEGIAGRAKISKTFGMRC